MTLLIIFIVCLDIFVLINFIVIPILRIGIREYPIIFYDTNRIVRKVIHKYINYKKMYYENKWFNNIIIINECDIPYIDWKLYKEGTSLFYFLDQNSDDIRPLLNSKLPYRGDRKLWLKSNLGLGYINASYFLKPSYSYVYSEKKIYIKTGNDIDTWIYLVSKEKFPKVYMLEFDFKTTTETKETLQLDFCCKSLAERFRFLLENNKTIQFEVVYDGFFLGRTGKMSNIKKDFSLPLNEYVKVQLYVINNIYSIFIDNNFIIGIKIKDYIPTDSFCYLIFWNGIEEKKIELEINNLKIYTPS